MNGLAPEDATYVNEATVTVTAFWDRIPDAPFRELLLSGRRRSRLRHARRCPRPTGRARRRVIALFGGGAANLDVPGIDFGSLAAG